MTRAIPLAWSPADAAALEQVQATLDHWLITTPAADQPAVARALAHLRTTLGRLGRPPGVAPGVSAALTGGALAAVDQARLAVEAALAAGGEEQPEVCAPLRQALEPLYVRERDAFAWENHHFNQMRRELGALAVWSLFGAGDLRAPHPLGPVSRLLYRVHWGPVAVERPIRGDTWLDLYRAAEACIRASGDRHHLFIEELMPVADRVATLELRTGS